MAVTELSWEPLDRQNTAALANLGFVVSEQNVLENAKQR